VSGEFGRIGDAVGGVVILLGQQCLAITIKAVEVGSKLRRFLPERRQIV
jgi:hypothetical protein